MQHKLHATFYKLIFILLLIFILTSCDDEKIEDFDAFYFAVISDTHLWVAPSDHQNNINFAEAGEELSQYSPSLDLVINTGDNIDDLFTVCDTASPPPILDIYKNMINEYYKMPYFIVLGNHDNRVVDTFIGNDCPNQVWVDTFIETESLPSPYYSFFHKGFQFIILLGTEMAYDHESNDILTLSETQLGWMEEKLSSGNPTLIFYHHSHFPEGDITSDSHPIDPVIDEYQDIIKAVFLGHGHRFIKYSWHGVDFYETTTMKDYPDPTYLIINADPDMEQITIENKAEITFDSI